MARAIDGLSKEAIEDLAELSMKLAANAETRRPFLKSVNKIEPNRRFPSVEVEDLREEMKAEREREKEERKVEEERRATEQRLAAQRDSLKGPGRGYSDEQIKEIEEVMTKYGLSDYEAGADLWQARRPAEVPQDRTGTWEFPTIGEAADFVADPVKASRNEAFKVINELRRNGRALQ